MQCLHSLPHRAHPRAEGVAHPGEGRLDEGLAATNEPAEDAHPIGEQAAVGRVMDHRLHRRAIDAQSATACDPCLPRQLDDAIIEGMQGRGLDRVRPAQQRRLVGHGLKVHPAEPAQHETVGDTGFGLTIAPVIEVLDDQESQDDFDRRGMAPVHERLRIAGCEIGADLRVEEIVVEEAVELLEDGIGPVRELGNAGEDIFVGVEIDQHTRPPAR